MGYGFRLKPESAWSGEAGGHWAPASRLTLSATGFYSRQHDAIDYVRASPASKLHAANLNGLRFAGLKSSLTFQPAQNHTLHVSWTALFGTQGALDGLQSEYVFNLPRSERARNMELDDFPRDCSQQCPADCTALPKDGLSGLGCGSGAGARLVTPVSSIPKPQQHGLPGDCRSDHARTIHCRRDFDLARTVGGDRQGRPYCSSIATIT